MSEPKPAPSVHLHLVIPPYVWAVLAVALLATSAAAMIVADAYAAHVTDSRSSASPRP